MNILAIVQARLGSSRFPSKVLKKINGKSVVSLIYGRLSKSKMIDDIVKGGPALVGVLKTLQKRAQKVRRT